MQSTIDDRIVSVGKKYNFDINDLISKFVYVNNYITVDFTYWFYVFIINNNKHYIFKKIYFYFINFSDSKL